MPGADGSTTSRPNAAPLSTPASSPIISARPAALVAADRQQHALADLVRIGDRLAGLAVHHPARLQRLAAERDAAGCCRTRTPRWRCRAPPAPRSPAGIAIAIGLVPNIASAPPHGAMWFMRRHRGVDADHAVLDRHRRIDAGGAGMIGVARADPADARLRAQARSRGSSHSVITRWPMPSSPSTSAVAGERCNTLMLAFGLTRPDLIQLQ